MTTSRRASPSRVWILAPLLLTLSGCDGYAGEDYADRVEIRRTSYGVPHILAEDLGSMAYGLAWAHMEDYGQLVVERLTMARGELALFKGQDLVESDFWWRRRHQLAAQAYPTLDEETRAIYEGYAAAVNRFIASHPERVQEWASDRFTGVDVAAHWVDERLEGATRRFLGSQAARRAASDSAAASGDGSNAWAVGPSRTASGNAILVRNPHFSWGAGRYSVYYEAHITVPGVIDFYGDFRVGYPMYFNGGFNANLGWSTTNNSPDIEEFYALTVDPGEFRGLPAGRRVRAPRDPRSCRSRSPVRRAWRPSRGRSSIQKSAPSSTAPPTRFMWFDRQIGVSTGARSSSSA